MNFAAPWMGLSALLALLVFHFAWRSRAPLRKVQLWSVVALEVCAVCAVAFALAEPWRASAGPMHRVAVLAGDHAEARAALQAWHDEAPASEPFHVITAGQTAQLAPLGTLEALPPVGAPDLTSSLRLAAALIPEGARGTVTVFGDARHDGAPLEELASEWTAREIALHWEATPAAATSATAAVRLIAVEHPSRVTANEPFRVWFRIDCSAANTPVEIRLRRADRVLARRDANLRSGLQRVELELALEESGALAFEAEVANQGEATALLSKERSAILVDRPLPILHLCPDASRREAMATTLAAFGLQTHAPLDPASLQPGDWQDVSAVIVDDLAATDWSHDAQIEVRRAVEERGLGLLLSGTHANLGPGGYGASPLAPILPVRMPQREERRDPSVALVVILDTSGSMGGGRIELAKEVARLAIQALQPHDKVGLVEFYGSKRWAAPLQPASNAIEITRALNRLQAGGGTVIYDALEEAYYALLNAHTRFQHVLVLTDGGVESGPFEAMARRMSAAGQNLSTVLIGPQGNSPFLMSLAQWGRGRFYACPDRFQLPELRFREPQSALLPSVEERTMALERASESDVLQSFSDGPLPPSGSIVEAGVREGAEVILRAGGKPYLVGWDRGAGRVLVLAGEALGPASALLREDLSYGAFLSDLVRNAAAGSIGSEAELQCRTQEAGVAITLVAPDRTALLEAPFLRHEDREFALASMGQGRWTTFVPWANSDVHEFEVRDGERAVVRGAAISPLDRRERCIDHQVQLSQLVAITGGQSSTRSATSARDATLRTDARTQGESLQPWGMILALVFFLSSILLRRLPLDRFLARTAPWLILLSLSAPLGFAQEAQAGQDDELEIYTAISEELRQRGDLSQLEVRWKDASASHQLALALANGDLKRAETLLSEPTLAASEPELALRLAIVRGNAEAALSSTATQMASDPSEPMAAAERMLLRASLESELGHRDAAREALQSAGAAVDDAAFHDRVGLYAAALGEMDLALRWHRAEGRSNKLQYQCHLRRALWHSRAGDIAAASAEYEAAFEIAPLERDAFFALALLLRLERAHSGLTQRADTWLRALQSGSETLPFPAVAALLEVLRELGRAEEAWEAYRALPSAAKERLRSSVIPLALEAGREEEALQALRERIAGAPKDLEQRVQCALLLSDLQRDEEAAEVLAERIPDATRPELRRLASVATELGLELLIERVANQVRAFDTPADRIDAALIESTHHVRRNRRTEAIALLKAVQEPTAPPADRMRLGEALESLGEVDAALKIFTEVYNETNAEDLGLRLAWMLSQSKDSEERDRALAIYRRLWLEAGSAARRVQSEDHVLDLAAREGTLADLAFELDQLLQDPNYPQRAIARNALVKIHSRAKDSIGAAAYLREWMRTEPEHEIEALEQLARVHLANDEYRAYGRVLQELIAKNPEAELDYRQQLALAALERGRPAEAQRCLQELLARESKLGATELEFAAGIYTLAGQHEDAVRLYRRSLALHPERVETFLLLGNALRSANRAELGIGLFQTLLLDDLPDDLYVVAMDGLLNLEADRKTLRAAAANVRLRLAERPDQVFLHRLLQDMLDALQESEARLAELEDTTLVAGEQRIAFVRELMQEAETRRDRQAYLEHGRTLMMLGDEVPPAIFLSLGEALLKEDQLDAASRAFDRARLAPDFASVEERVAELFERSGRLAEAERARKRLLRRTPEDTKQILATARICEQLAADDRALKLYMDAAQALLESEIANAATKAPARGTMASGSAVASGSAIRIVAMNRNVSSNAPGFAEAWNGFLRSAQDRSAAAPMADLLWQRYADCSESELGAEILLAGYLRQVATAYGDHELSARLSRVEEERIAKSSDPKARQSAVAAARLSAADFLGWAAVAPAGETWNHLRWLFLNERWSEVETLLANLSPSLRAEAGRCFVLAGMRDQAEVIAEDLKRGFDEHQDGAGEAYAKLAEWLGRPVDQAALADARLQRALDSNDPFARRARTILSALQAHPSLDRSVRLGHLADLASEIASENDLNLVRTLLDQAGTDLDASVTVPLVERLFAENKQPHQLAQDARFLSLLPAESSISLLRTALQAMPPDQRRTQALRLVQTQHAKLPLGVLKAVLSDFDLRKLERTEFYSIQNLARSEDTAPEILELIRERLSAADASHPFLAVLRVRVLPAAERAPAALVALRSLLEERRKRGAQPEGDLDWNSVRTMLTSYLQKDDARLLASELSADEDPLLQADLLEHAGDREAAANALLAIAQGSEPNVSALYRAARMLQDLERFEEARLLYRQARDQSPQFYPFQASELAQLELRAGDPAAALEALKSTADAPGQNSAVWIEVIAALPDAEQRRALLRRLSAQSSPQGGMVFYSSALRRNSDRTDRLSATLAPPSHLEFLDPNHSEVRDESSDPAQIYSRLPEGAEHVARLLRAEDVRTLERDDTLIRAQLYIAQSEERVEEVIGRAMATLATHPFDHRALLQLRAATALQLPVPAEAREQLFRWRATTQQLDAMTLVELYLQSLHYGDQERAASLRQVLVSTRAFFSDTRLIERFVPSFLQQEAKLEELLALLPPEHAPLDPRVDAELLGAALLRGVDLDQLEATYAQRIDERNEENVYELGLHCARFGLAVARGDIEALPRAIKEQHLRFGRQYCPMHALGLAIPPLALWRDPNQVAAVAEFLLSQSAIGPAEGKALFARFAAVLVHRLREAERFDAADELETRVRSSHPDLKAEAWFSR